MKPIAFVAMVGVIAVAFCEPAAARGSGGGGGRPPGGLNGPGMHAFSGGGIRAAMPPPSVGGRQFANSRGPRSFGGRQVAMNGNLRSNRGGLRRGHERAAYVHRLNNERRDTGETDGRTRTTGTNATGRGGTTSAGSSAGGTTATGGATSGTSGSSTATGSGRHSALAPLSR